MNKELSALIDKSKRSINAAKMLVESDDYDFAISRAYYALFYISEALLLMKSQSYSKHSAVISAIYKEFVHNGELSKDFHKTLKNAFDLRQQSDYLSQNMITKEIALKVIDDVEKSMGLALPLIT